MDQDRFLQGAQLTDEGVRYRIWAPHVRELALVLCDANGAPLRELPMQREPLGFFECLDPDGGAGELYKYRLDGADTLPDPASRLQPLGVHGPSMVIDPATFEWSDSSWRVPRLRDLVIYELHVGTFTAEGTFRAAIEKLEHLCELGVNAIELMPIGEFAGARNWGYDGVYLYAPSHNYGHPDDLRALVDAAHRLGIAVILDVVYNHFGPDGNYLARYIGDYLDESAKTPWGGAIRYGEKGFEPLRALVARNPAYWVREFHIDGFRLDATHAIMDESPRHILAEITASIHAHGRFAIAEDSRNQAQLLEDESAGGLGFDAVWADDFHHVVRVGCTREKESYFAEFDGTLAELADTLQHGWLYRGQTLKTRPRQRGTECRHLAPEQFVHCISNHDQVGNRALGERLSQTATREAYLAASTLLCLTPYSPLLFMGQEWAASTPFLFFTDHHTELGRLVTAGRRREFREFAAFHDPRSREQIPDPQSEITFLDSKLAWHELTQTPHASVLTLYRECLRLRAGDEAFRPRDRSSWQVEAVPPGLLALRMRSAASDWLLLADLLGEHASTLDAAICRPPSGKHWQQVLATSEERFGGSGTCGVNPKTLRVDFTKPEAVLLRAE